MSTPLSKIEAISIKVRDHLLSQRAQALTELGECLYRCPNGTMCAVGALIPDNLYDPSIEHLEVSTLEVMNVVLKATGTENESTSTQQALEWVLTRWQGYHDSPHVFEDDIVDLRYSKFIYQDRESHSPETMHQSIMAELALRHPKLFKEQQ